MSEPVPSEGRDDARPTPRDPGLPGPELRASDADRERVTEVLRDALAEGRLDMEEFEERLEATYKARTYGELAPITRDLPAPGVTPPVVNMVKGPAEGGTGAWADRIVGGEGSSSWGVAILAGFQRKGRWTMPKRFNSFAFWGGGEIDLREAYFADREVVVNCVAIMGGMTVVVPLGVEVVVRGIGIMGGFDHSQEGVLGEPGAPRVIVTGFAFWGGVGVDRKLTRAERQRLKEERRQEKLERREARKELGGSRSDGDGLGDAFDVLEEARDLVRERREDRREGDEERRERHQARRDERHRRRHGGHGGH